MAGPPRPCPRSKRFWCPESAVPSRALVCELRRTRTEGYWQVLILIPLFDLTLLVALSASGPETSNRRPFESCRTATALVQKSSNSRIRRRRFLDHHARLPSTGVRRGTCRSPAHA